MTPAHCSCLVAEGMFMLFLGNKAITVVVVILIVEKCVMCRVWVAKVDQTALGQRLSLVLHVIVAEGRSKGDGCPCEGLCSMCFPCQSPSLVKKQPSQDVLHGDAAEEELGLACLVSSYTLPHQNSQPGRRGRQTAHSKMLSRHARDT